MQNIFSQFIESHDYPSELIMRHGGVPKDTLYNYVCTSFLNGFINLVMPIKAVVVERYCDNWDEVIPLSVEKITEQCYTHLGDIEDDVWILAESYEDYWLFIYDKDTSDCVIGRFAKENTTREVVLKQFDSITQGNDGSCKGKTAGLELTGWITG